MQKTIWYGSHDNNVRFASDQNTLKQQGIDNPQSFTVTGEVEGLTLIDSSTGNQSQSGGAVAA